MKLNHTKIDNTKSAMKEVLKKMDKFTDSFIDQLVQLRPNQFTGEDSDSVIDPFVLITLMTKELEFQFNNFKSSVKVEEQPKGEIVDFKKKGDTTH